MQNNSKLTIVNQHLNYQSESLIDPSEHVFIHLAIEVDHSPLPFFISSSSQKKNIISQAKQYCTILELLPEVVSALVFQAVVIPPGQGKLLKERQGVAKIAQYDIAVLIEVSSKTVAQQLQENESFLKLKNILQKAAKQQHFTVASNARQIAPVNHQDQGIFLFNYFYADDVEQNLAVWEYTVGWFEEEAHLDNSMLFLPLSEDSSYSVINHCRWDSLWDILPALMLKKTFHQYVLANFYANQVAAMPILYRLA